MADKKKKKPASLGCIFWIAFILLIIVLFFFNRKNIDGVLEKTGAVALFSGLKTKVELTAANNDPAMPKIKTKETEPIVSTTEITPSGDGSKESTAEPETTTKPAPMPESKPVVTLVKPETKPVVQTEKPAAVSVVKKPVAPKVETVKPSPMRKSTLFFVTIDQDGRVIRKEVMREIPVSDSPLSETLNTLFKGTNSAEAKKEYRSLIPQGTRLLSATVTNGVATINLSEEFQFNQFGIEGYLGQLSQIVFTATAFSTVKSVQFLIEGQKREYLGAEGVWIGTPLSRDKF